jgi:asparagine synthase (glutamine-hydrolysing)
MVQAMGVPLSTPNEVAINEVARRLRADGKIVTLSGEGADELFGGYEAVIRAAGEFEGVWGSGGTPAHAPPPIL